MNLGYRPYKDVIYRLDGYVISDLEEATYPEFELFHKEEIIYSGQKFERVSVLFLL